MRGEPGGRRSLRHRYWWLAPELIALALIGAVAYQPLTSPTSTPATVHERIGARVVAAIEQASPGEHHDHGHSVTAGEQVLCTVEVYGTDPPSPVRVSEVQAVYGYYLCAVGAPGTQYLQSRLSGGPVMARPAELPTVHVPRPGHNYRDEIRALLPVTYEERAVQGFTSDAKPTELRQRFERLVTFATPAPPSTPGPSPTS